jgi:hypothetical protein
MAPVRGRCRRGERLIGRVPHGHRKITTFVGGLRQDGNVAPFVIDRPVNGDIFLAYLDRCLILCLTPGDTVILDNLALIKSPGFASASRPRAHDSSTFRLIRPISTRSSSPSPSSRRCCDEQPSAQSRGSGTVSANSSTSSPPRMRKLRPPRGLFFGCHRNPL